jgi:hypothetical protein
MTCCFGHSLSEMTRIRSSHFPGSPERMSHAPSRYGSRLTREIAYPGLKQVAL